MKKAIGLITIIFIFMLCFTSCGCETCGGSENILCRACNGKGKETCDICDGTETCDHCDNGMIRDDPCSNKNCEFGYVITSSGRFKCGECDGTGYEERKCSFCDGSNRCYKCDGTGLKENAQTCSVCDGAGRITCPSCK